jgi:hypothetical protein
MSDVNVLMLLLPRHLVSGPPHEVIGALRDAFVPPAA